MLIPPKVKIYYQLTLYIMFTARLLFIVGFAFSLPFTPFYIRELGVANARLVPLDHCFYILRLFIPKSS